MNAYTFDIDGSSPGPGMILVLAPDKRTAVRLAKERVAAANKSAQPRYGHRTLTLDESSCSRVQHKITEPGVLYWHDGEY